MRSVTHYLRNSSLKCSKQTFTVRSAILNSFTSSVFPSEAIEETSGIQELKNSKAQRNKTDQTVHEARLFRGSIVKTEHVGLTSLTFILVPGADRVVRHICMGCMLYGKILTKKRTIRKLGNTSRLLGLNVINNKLKIFLGQSSCRLADYMYQY